MRILIVTDAWHPQINGVVRTLTKLGEELRRLGHQPLYLTPDRFPSVACPTYPEIRLALPRNLAARMREILPDAIHIATEGPLGWAARAYCTKRGLPFTTAFHTKFPEYLRVRFRVPENLTYALLRRFHAPASAILVSTATLEGELAGHGFSRLRRWTRGVDGALFHPRSVDEIEALAPELTGLPRPIFLAVGRIAPEKNLSAFLDLDLPGTKLVVGSGPDLEPMRRHYPEARFLGSREGEALGAIYAAADVFVFPSLTDTFGLVLLEALASGTPVAAFPVAGPLDVLGSSKAGMLDRDLGRAALAALAIPPATCLAHARTFGWEASARQFLSHLTRIDGEAWKKAA